MNILLAQSTVAVPTHGGENKANRRLLEDLASRGHSCRIVAPAYGAQGPATRGQFLAELSARGLRPVGLSTRADVFRCAGVEVHAVGDLPELRAHFSAQIHEFAPDVILVSSQDPGQVLLETAVALQPSRVVYLAHTMLFFPFGPNSFAARRRGVELLQQTAGIITVSNYLKDYIRHWAGCEATVIPFPAFGHGPFPRFGSFDRGFVTLVNPCAYKGITIFLELARSLPEQMFAAVPSWGTTEQDRAALERLPNVRLLPPDDDPDSFFEKTRVLLAPSLGGEGFGLVPLEAMLRGIPVIASDCGGLPEAKLGVDYVLPVRPLAGFRDELDDRKLPVPIVPAQDIGPWRDALCTLLRDRSRYELLSEESRKAAGEYVSSLSSAPFEKFFRNLSATPEAMKRNESATELRRETDRSKAHLLERVSALSTDRRALLASRLRNEETGSGRDERILRRGQFVTAPVSFAQERLWFFDRLQPGSYAYNITRAFRFGGSLNRQALQAALDALVQRHETLRTGFTSHDGTPVQVIADELTVPILLTDRTGVSAATRESEMQGLLAAEARRPFDLTRPPLLRAHLYRLGEQEHVLLLTVHHIVTDGWSMEVMYRELATLYSSFSTGAPSRLPELPIQYADFACWQRERLSGELLAPSLDYWRQRLAGAPAFLDLPSDRSRPAIQTLTAGSVSRVVPSRVQRALKALGWREGTTLFMTLLAAFDVLLSRHAGAEDIVVGSPIAERSRTETEGLIGLLLNTLALRSDLSGDPSFRELLARVRAITLDAFVHQEVPFEKVVEHLQPTRDLSRTPIFQIFFNMLNFATSKMSVPGLTIEPFETLEPAARFDLTLYASEQGDGIRLLAVYNAELFEESRIAQMLEQLTGLLEQIVANPDERISSYTLRTDSSHHLLPDPSVSIEEPEVGLTLAEFSSWATRTPSSRAIVDGPRVLSYADLESRSRGVAEFLSDGGLVRGEVVAVTGPRSAGLIVAMLGVLRCGGVLLTLDPALPAERKRTMASEGGARRLLVAGAVGEAGSWVGERLAVTAVREDGSLPAGGVPRGLPLPTPRPDDPAYIFFTSGTTGVPKGILGCHKGLAHFLKWERETFGVGPDDRCAQLSGLSFDAVLRDVFLPLTSGGSLHLPDPRQDVAASGLLSWLQSEGITIIHTVPAVAQSWLSAPPAGIRLNRLRWVFFAGEPLTDALLRRWFAAFPEGGRAVNLYGPTETTMVKTFFVVPEEPPIGIQPLGEPLPDTQLFVLAEGRRLCGIGEAGEIVLRTPFRTLGYINAPDEQRERFVPNPFRSDPRDLIYRTGDRGRHRLDGSVDFLGRLDDQVKIRGVRVEPGEVAAVLLRHPEVASCVVVARRDDQGDAALVAYVVTPRQGPETVAELRAHLARQLPAAMMPSAFVFLRQLPLTANGKVDRAALPAPAVAAERPADTFVSPRTPLEEVLASIWVSVLRVERVGVYDNFFELGGHSLKATQVMSRICGALGLDLPLRTLFEAPTLASLASAIEGSLLDEIESVDWGGRRDTG